MEKKNCAGHFEHFGRTAAITQRLATSVALKQSKKEVSLAPCFEYVNKLKIYTFHLEVTMLLWLRGSPVYLSTMQIYL